MDLPAAIERIEKSFKKLNAAYGSVVFDELAIVDLSGVSVKLLHYDGPRSDDFMSHYSYSSSALRRELDDDLNDHGGEFHFTHEGDGPDMDASICLGPKVYLFCNDVKKTMKEITQDPRWLAAQGEFLNASQYFAVDPLILE